MTRKYFGTDGVRGRVGEAPITPDFVMRLGYAAGKVLALGAKQQSQGRPTVLIGKDTRISGYMLEAALEAGFTSAGVHVLLTGPLPTPGVAYLTRALRLAAGVVISASHNPYYDNGIKFFSSGGDKLPDEVELAIEAELEKPMICVRSDDLGRARRIEDAAGRYIEFCKSTFPYDLDLHQLKLVVDCAHGAAYHIAPHVFHELGAEVITIGNQPDGRNINAGYGATAPEKLIEAVKTHGAALGLAFDGDADRLQMVDASGRLFNGDELLYAIVQDRLAAGQPVQGVVGTLMTNMAIELALQRQGVELVRAKVGDRYVLEELNKRGWVVGGEGSGHLLCLDRHSTGDGIVSALQVLAALRRSGKTLAQMLEGVSLFPQTLINVRVEKGFDWQTHAGLSAARAAVEPELAGKGRVLIRASGTEPVVRVMVEAEQVETAERAAQTLADALRA
ncbi:phosphoglucosamine mutase [Cupriavidus respiraculi]|uniref:Phosphoglucosamine mutase n=1 Tax=Cupriavidus respiraculi TaxID=195930 RepID=A0ABN7Z767_9BURK|nr:phosphoglucosamine mutase [Cupriavidus respiraculi]MBY4946921.1 phosphoglucosamine mutase [Cupriavidus respiraculi]CAG9181774.1 Phosphoglucosamine mutase [Cupriavidus respiraculi]